MIYVILSLGKSGSSLLSETLHKDGIRAFEDESIGADTCERFEDEKVCQVNRDYFYPNHQSMNMHFPVVDEASPELIDRMRSAIRNGAGKYKEYCIKDPRMSYTYHLWRKVLPKHKLIIQFRHPSEVVEHYLKIKRAPGILDNISDRYMHVYLKAIKHSKENESLFISHESLINYDLDKLRKFTGHTFERNQVKSNKYRCKSREYVREDTTKLYNMLKGFEDVQ